MDNQSPQLIFAISITATFITFFWITTLYQKWVDESNEEVELARLNDQQRHAKVLKVCSISRTFPRLIFALELANRDKFLSIQKKIQKWLIMAGLDFWTPSEFLAAAELKSLIAGFALGVFFLSTGLMNLPVLILITITITCGTFILEMKKLQSNAEYRTETIGFRIPYAIDQISLILDAGGHFHEAIGLVLKEMENHPLADELNLVYRSMKLGVHRHESLKEMSSRLNMPMVTELVTTIIQGENCGTPLAEIIRVQAEQMRLKRSQMIEQFAAKIGVKMSFPGMLCMISCLVIVVTMFVLWMVKTVGGEGGIFNV
jgi:tight adherence protein C